MMEMTDAATRAEVPLAKYYSALQVRLRKTRGTLGNYLQCGGYAALTGSDASMRVPLDPKERLDVFGRAARTIVAQELDFLDGDWVELGVTRTWISARDAVSAELGRPVHAPTPAHATKIARDRLSDFGLALVDAVTAAAGKAVEAGMNQHQAWKIVSAAFDEVVKKSAALVIVDTILITDRNSVMQCRHNAKLELEGVTT